MPIAIVPDGLRDQRADVGAARLFGVTRSRVEQAAEKGHLLLDGSVIHKSERLKVGALLEIDLEEPRQIRVRPREVEGMTITYEDADIVVVDKPAGIAAHPSLGWDGGSVLEHLAAVGIPVATSGAAERAGIVSRLDVGTSGLMVVAKSDHAYCVLKNAFRDREVDKTYHALVQGFPDPTAGTIDAPIGHARGDEWKMAIDPSGRRAVTHYRVLEILRKASLVEVDLETGRTHQIRVHMAGIQHPCVGDLVYGADPRLADEVGLVRQWLHSCQLRFTHPRSGRPVEFTSAYPEDLEQALSVLR